MLISIRQKNPLKLNSKFGHEEVRGGEDKDEEREREAGGGRGRGVIVTK